MTTDATAKATSVSRKEPSSKPSFLSRRQAIRLIVIILSIVVTAFFRTTKAKLSQQSLTMLHLFSFACYYGCSVWVSFIAGIVMFRNLPRHVFGRLQSKLFPRYFQFCIVFLTISLVSFTLLSREKTTDGLISSVSREHAYQVNYLALILLTNLVNLYVLEPMTTRVMYQRHVVEKKLGTGHEIGQLKSSDPKVANDPEIVRLTKKFGPLHGMSSSLNLIGLCLGAVHLFWVAGKVNF